jgi:hypothetical protein
VLHNAENGEVASSQIWLILCSLHLNLVLLQVPHGILVYCQRVSIQLGKYGSILEG